MLHYAPATRVDFWEALASGEYPENRPKRVMAVLQAYADESDSGDRKGVFVLAAFVAKHEDWTEFSRQWKAELDRIPRMPYFKMQAITSAKWQKEHGITKGQANQKLSKLIPIIQAAPIAFSSVSAIWCPDHAEVIRSTALGDHPWLKEPYHFCFHEFVARTISHALCHSLTDIPLSFVVDENAKITEDAVAMFKYIREHPYNETEVVKMMGNAIPGDDRVLAPLQAADILAYRVMKHCTKPRNPKLEQQMRAVSGSGRANITFHWRKKHLLDFAARLERRMLSHDAV